jgi:putative RNA 2'-phosphotransferase
LDQIVAKSPKQRFAFDPSGTRIRASQGHSVHIDLGYPPTTPPDILWHGTGQKNVDSIMRTGLDKRQRTHVHLSADRETAITVGRRHGSPALFKVDAKQMHEDGYSFYISDNGVWLTDNVPVRYLILQVGSPSE